MTYRSPFGSPPPALEENGAEIPAEHDFGPILVGLRPLIPRALLDGPGWERVLERVGGLPGNAAAAACGFEFRLDQVAPAADVSIPVKPGLALERYVAGADGMAAPGSAQAVLARHLHRIHGIPSARIDETMLEFDVASIAPGARPAPGLFVKFRNADPGQVARILLDAKGLAPDRRERLALDRALAALPPQGEIIQAGVLLGRARRGVRLVARKIRLSDVPGYLERLGQPGPVATWTAVVREIEDLFRTFWLSFDVAAAGVSPRIGLEFGPCADKRNVAVSGRWWATGLRDWRPIIDRLEARGWCLPVKARGLRSWPGRDTIFESRGVFTAYRGINHIKLVLGDGPVHAKAYAGMAYRPIGPPDAGRAGRRSGR